MNRAQRRQAARSQGLRGAKAKRQRANTLAPKNDDTDARQRARAFGLVVGPSDAEIEAARHGR